MTATIFRVKTTTVSPAKTKTVFLAIMTTISRSKTKTVFRTMTRTVFHAMTATIFRAKMKTVFPSVTVFVIPGLTGNLPLQSSHRPATSSSWMIPSQPVPRCTLATPPCAPILPPASPSRPSPPLRVHLPPAHEEGRVSRRLQMPAKTLLPRDGSLSLVANTNNIAADKGRASPVGSKNEEKRPLGERKNQRGERKNRRYG